AGNAFRPMLHTLDRRRIAIGALALGSGEAALAGCLADTSQRKQLGRRIATAQGVPGAAADRRTEPAAPRHLVYDAASPKPHGPRPPPSSWSGSPASPGAGPSPTGGSGSS